MIKEYEKFLYEMSTGWGLTVTGPLKFFLFNNYHPHSTNIDIFWFHRTERSPFLVTKLSRVAVHFEREYENLKQGYAHQLVCIPRPLYCGRLGCFHTLWMTGLRGSPTSPGDPRLAKYIGRLVDAVIDMHRRLRCPGHEPEGQRVRRLVEEPLKTVAEYGTSATVRRCCQALQKTCSDLVAHQLPVIPQHGDLFFGNVLRNGRQFYFVDWENFNIIDFPYYDLFTLLFSFLRRFGRTPEHCPARVAKQIPKLIRRYTSELSLSVGNPAPLFPLTLANWFHMLYSFGRQKFAGEMYKSIESYFENEHRWQKTLFNCDVTGDT